VSVLVFGLNPDIGVDGIGETPMLRPMHFHGLSGRRGRKMVRFVRNLVRNFLKCAGIWEENHISHGLLTRIGGETLIAFHAHDE
jgi:hypothetical protein